jgi:cell division transport system permease protein
MSTTHRPGPIVSPEAAPLKTLTVAMAVMCYLACLAIGALILINRAADAWTGDLAREVTVQVRQTSGADIEKEVAKAEALLQSTTGIAAIEVLDRDAGARLLEPWLGTIRNVEELPIPRLIAVTIDRNAPPDFAALEKSLGEEVQGASLDTHRRWQGELTRMATVLKRLSYAVLILICISAVAVVIFAARSVLDGNRDIVDVLQLAGARDDFIAGQIQSRFLKTGLAAGLIGMAMGLATYLIVGMLGPWSGADAVADASRALLFAPPGTAWKSYAALAAVPVIVTVIVIVTTRTTLMRILRGL